MFAVNDRNAFAETSEVRGEFVVPASNGKKKADAAEHPEVFHRVGLLTNQPPGVDRAALYSVFRCD